MRESTHINEPDLPSHYRRNFWCLVADFCFFGIAMRFFGTSTVIPGFLNILGASTTVIGLISTLAHPQVSPMKLSGLTPIILQKNEHRPIG